jgi:Coenzyme PQQ synthesis protein D (PqqD)
MPDTITPDIFLKTSPDCVVREIAGETVLLHLETGFYFGLDEVGTTIWSLLKEERTYGALLEELHEHYEVDRVVLEAEISAFVSDLLDHDLVVTRTLELDKP